MDEPRSEERLAAAARLALAHGRWCRRRRIPYAECPFDNRGALVDAFMAFHWCLGWIAQSEGCEGAREAQWEIFTCEIFRGVADLGAE